MTTPVSLTHPAECPGDFGSSMGIPATAPQTSSAPTPLYAISARVAIFDRSAPGQTSFHCADLPTFYLDSDVQGIMSEDHARRIVVRMLADLGHAESDCYVQASATLRPIFDRTTR